MIDRDRLLTHSRLRIERIQLRQETTNKDGEATRSVRGVEDSKNENFACIGGEINNIMFALSDCKCKNEQR